VQKISIALNAVLLLAVGILFYLVFSLKNQISGASGNDSVSVASVPLPKAEGKIMYINIDSLETEYEYFQQIKADLEKRAKANENEIKGLYNGFQATYQKYEQQAQTGAMTEQQREAAQADLAQKEKSVREREEAISQAYAKKAQELNDQFLKYVQDYLKKKSKEHNYSYVLGYVKESNLLYVNDSLDITKQVVGGLNAEYKAAKTKK
jgi:outer membrane protein